MASKCRAVMPTLREQAGKLAPPRCPPKFISAQLGQGFFDSLSCLARVVHTVKADPPAHHILWPEIYLTQDVGLRRSIAPTPCRVYANSRDVGKTPQCNPCSVSGINPSAYLLWKGFQRCV